MKFNFYFFGIYLYFNYVYLINFNNIKIERAIECEPTDKASIHLQQRLREGIESGTWTYIEDLVKY